MGKHQKAIQTADFSSDGKTFAIGSADNTISINNIEGDIIRTISCNSEIGCLQFTRFRRIDGKNEKPLGDKNEDFVKIYLIKFILDKCYNWT